MKKSALLVVVIVLCFTTCKKENNPENLCYSNTLISQINSGNYTVQGLTYNSNCLLYESMQPFKYEKYLYDGQNRLKKVEEAMSIDPLSCSIVPGASSGGDPRKAKVGVYSDFEYDDASRLIKKSTYLIYTGHPELFSYQTYEYQNNQMIKLSEYNAQGGLTTYNEYKYDERGNITRNDLYTMSPAMRLYETMIYEYDNKFNPYQIFAAEGTPGQNTNRNNIVSETTISYNGVVESRSTKQNVYEYNELDYPVKINSWDCLYGKVN
jgi:hypothetical protein